MSADVHSLIGAYVLDALDDLERAAFDRHLRDCAACRSEADELFEVTARLADASWSVPSPRLRENVMAAIESTRQLPPQIPPRAAAPARVKTNRTLRLVAAAAAVTVALGAATAVYQMQDQRVRDARATAAEAQAREARVRSILGAPDVVVRNERLNSGGQVTVASSQSQNAGVIMLAADAAPGPGQVYQLWTIRGETPSSQGALPVGQATTVQVVEGLPGAAAVGITVERAPGATAPTAPLDAAVKLV